MIQYESQCLGQSNVIYFYFFHLPKMQPSQVFLGRIIDAPRARVTIRSRGPSCAATSGSISVVDLVDEIRQLPGKRSIHSGGSTRSSHPCRVHPIVIGGSDRRGWRGIWAQKEPRRILPEEFLFPLLRSPSFCSDLFFSHHFYPSPPTSIFFTGKPVRG